MLRNCPTIDKVAKSIEKSIRVFSAIISGILQEMAIDQRFRSLTPCIKITYIHTCFVPSHYSKTSKSSALQKLSASFGNQMKNWIMNNCIILENSPFNERASRFLTDRATPLSASRTTSVDMWTILFTSCWKLMQKSQSLRVLWSH